MTSLTPSALNTDNQAPTPHPTSTTDCGWMSFITVGTISLADCADRACCSAKNSLLYSLTGRSLAQPQCDGHTIEFAATGLKSVKIVLLVPLKRAAIFD